MKQLVKSAVLSCARRSRLIQSVATFIHENISQVREGQSPTAIDSYADLKRKFIENGRRSPVDEAARTEMVSRFEETDRAVPIASTPTDGLILAELLISCKGAGDVVECGCYAGGSTAKLSIIARSLGKQVFVFDSFEGLPAVDSYNLRDVHARRGESWVTNWTAGRYAARLNEVKGNVSRYGEIDICTFVQGWFSDTLNASNLPDEIAFAFTDVDIPSSARDCLEAIWPRLSELGIYVSHDAAWIKVLQNLHDPKLWREEFRSFPPIFFGAGFGIYDTSPHIGYFVKGEDLPAEYLKEITIDK